LADAGAIDGDTVQGHIFDRQTDHIAPASLAVDGQIEHGQVVGKSLIVIQRVEQYQ
jgi:hypothetical protein